MNRVAFENYLRDYRRPNGEHLTGTAIDTRLRKAVEAEDVLGHSLDDSVRNDEQMREDLITLRTNNGAERRYGQMQNALRKYYHMVHGRQFPQLRYL